MAYVPLQEERILKFDIINEIKKLEEKIFQLEEKLYKMPKHVSCRHCNIRPPTKDECEKCAATNIEIYNHGCGPHFKKTCAVCVAKIIEIGNLRCPECWRMICQKCCP